jgi:hypothetical protein
VPIVDEPEVDAYIDEDDEELMKAVIASLDMAEKENSFHFEEGSNVNNDSNSIGSNNSATSEVWPTVAESHGNNNSQPLTEDEELRYILELSKTEK